ncbi:DUF3221 domain-containing protein [Sutcliffiella cohnii]|uniref:DUF3221 domain-containing protein n=1 Tax=Sutcliffiella cohnii TaxID=33932 RepID=A0A223KSP4_9BACI|nr:DUF3221 domain-containing protein [Sutcliffiella cohnii]AST92364.1 hypothetical protein BC6307_14225 [Sutcliffiella cohnii]MED4017173.1 DUF3221 domain-containing protein [Sutcliffiella cohnii]
MKYMKFFLFVSCFFLLMACGTTNNGATNGGTGSDQDDPAQEEEGVKDLTGHIVSIDGNRILVTGENAHNSVSATWYTIDDNTLITLASGREPGIVLQVGMKVETWNTGIVLESFPSQASAVKIIVDDSQPLKEREAIEQALSEVDPSQPWLVATVEEEGDMYKVTLKNLLSDDEEVEIEVKVE